MGGLATARGLGRFYAALIDNAPGRGSRVREAASLALRYRRGPAHDPVLDRPNADFAAGFMVDLGGHGYGSAIGSAACGHTGWMGSSWGFADAVAGVACGFVHNGWVPARANDVVRAEIVDAVYELASRA